MLGRLQTKFAFHGSLYQYVATFTGILSTLSFGLSVGWASPSLPKFLNHRSKIPVSSAEGSWLAVLNVIGLLFSTILIAFTANKFGRKRALLLTSFMYLTGWTLIAFATTLQLLMAGRFLLGMGDGISYVYMGMYISEIAHPDLRGSLSTMQTLSMLIGAFLMNILGSYLSISAAALVCACVPVIHFVSFCTMPESSYYLLMKGNEKDARRSLQKLRGTLDVEEELTRQRDAIKQETKGSGQFFELFSERTNRKALYICLMLIGTTFFCGAVAIGTYLQIIVKEIDVYASPITFSIMYTSTHVVTSLTPSLLVDSIGRKPLLVVSCVGSFIVLAFEGTYLYLKNCTSFNTENITFLPLVFLLLFTAFQGVGMGSIPFMLIGELFQTKVKLYASTFIGICIAVVIIIVSKFFQISKDKLGIHVPFFTFSAFCIINLLIVIFIMPETKKKTLEEIQEHLKK